MEKEGLGRLAGAKRFSTGVFKRHSFVFHRQARRGRGGMLVIVGIFPSADALLQRSRACGKGRTFWAK